MTKGEKTLLWVGVLAAGGVGVYLLTRPKALAGGTYNPGNATQVWSGAVQGNRTTLGSSVQLQGPNGEQITSSLSSNPAVLAPAAGTTDGYIALSKGTATLSGTYLGQGQLINTPQATVVPVTVI
jgi:hypothetical protein